MYSPAHFRITSQAQMHRIIEAHPLGTLVTKRHEASEPHHARHLPRPLKSQAALPIQSLMLSDYAAPPAQRALSRRQVLGLAIASTAGSAKAWLQPVSARMAITVAAASHLKFALQELAAGFEKAAGQPIRLVFGSSGQLYSQILQGAPFHLFFSADEEFVLRLLQNKRAPNAGRVYAQGRIGILVPQNGPIAADRALRDLSKALQDGRLQRLAIANPEHAPYGVLAIEALQRAGLYPAIKKHLVFGENVSQAAQFALSGSTQGGIVAHSLALAPGIAAQSRFALIDARWHRTLLQRMVLLHQAPPAAKAFYDHLATPAAQAVLQRHGFTLP